MRPFRGVPKRRAETWPWMDAAIALRSASARPSWPYNGVEIGPGADAFTRIPRKTPVFGMPMCALTEALSTIEAGLAKIGGNA